MTSGDNRLRWTPPLIFVCGAAPVVLALMVLVGWYTERISLVQVLPTFAPMQINTALGFLLCGAGLLLHLRRRTFLAAGFGAAAALIGLLTLSQYLFSVELGIDQFFLEPFVTVKTANPGRMATNTALTFFFSGLGLVFLGRSNSKRYAGPIAGIFGSLVFGQAAVVGITYVAGVEHTFSWGLLTHMAIHTAAGFAFLGTGLLIAAWSKDASEEEPIPIWLPFPTGIAVATLTFGLWLSLSAENSAQIDRKTALKAEGLKIGLTELMEAKINALIRLAQRWERRGGTPREEWEADTALYVTNDPSYQAIEWVDRTFRVRWIIPAESNEQLDRPDHGLTSYRRDLLTTARDRRTISVSRLLNRVQGREGISISVPLFPGGQFDGFIVGVFRLDKLLAAFIEKKQARYSVHIFEGDEKIYDYRSDAELHPEGRGREFSLDVRGTTWRVAIHPTPELLEEEKSNLPTIFLIVGLLLSAVLALMVNFAIKAGRTAKEAARADQNERFNTALDNMSQGLCMFDAEQRIIVANGRYAAIYGLTPEQVKPGTTLGQVVEYRIANGFYAGENPGDYIQERQDWVSGGACENKIQNLNDGRAIAITRRPMSGGGWVTTHEDVTDLTQTQQVVERQKEELVQILRNVPRAVITCDNSGIIRMFNPAAEETFGYAASEAIGRNVSLLMPDEDKKHHDGYMRSYVETGVSKFIEVGPRRLLGRHKDGTLFPMELALGVVGQGKDTGFIAVAWDITEELKAEKKLIEHRDLLQQEVDLATVELKVQAVDLREALAKEQELNKLQREFVSMASHEFRTPLAIIDATAQRMKSRADKNRLTPEDAVRRIEKIRGAVNRMTRLMDSTLAAARMQEGKIRVEIKPCDIGKVVREVCARQQEISQAHVISCDLAGLPATIQADAGSLEQVLANLLSNAVKYALDAPDIEIKARTAGDQVVISVRDHGLGIDEDELDRIGERFFRARTSTGIAGTGIGLNLAKTLVEMHGGRVDVESKKGEGSTFTVRLPIAGPDQTDQADTKVA